MSHKFGHITLLVNSIDDAANFYTKKLDFVKTADIKMPDGFHWLTVSPKDQRDFGIVFVLADNEEMKNRVGNQVANHVLLTLKTEDCERDYKLYKSRGVNFFGEPKQMPWGTEVVFEDLYGNRFDLIEAALNE